MKNFSKTTKHFFYLFLLGFFSLISNFTKAQTCQAEFTYNIGSNGVVYFNSVSTSSDSIGSYYWSFGNNQFAYTQNPTTDYLNSGVYNVCLIITTLNQTCVDTICQQITINLNCNLTAQIQSDSLAGTMTVIPIGGLQPFTYVWNNGSTQSTIAPTTIGNYCVTISDAAGCTTTACYDWNGMYCNIGFSYNAPSPSLYNFFAAGLNGAQATWNFGDGSTITSSSTNMQHVYSASGTYLVCISIPNCQAYCTYINVNLPLPCAGVTTDIVSFQNNTFLIAEVFNANYPITYQWTTGDTGQTIATNGQSTFCVTITDAVGCTATDCISVNSNCNMTVTLDTLTNPGGITATVSNGVQPYIYTWNGGASVWQNVLFPTGTGQYCVQVSDMQGCMASACVYFDNGSGGCTINLNVVTDSIAGTMTAYASGGTAPYSYSWINGSNQAVISPATSGTYCVTVTDALGCTNIACDYFYGSQCNAGFTYSSINQGQIMFVTYGTNGQNVTWDFGDGTAPIITSANQVTHTYGLNGYYSVCMSVAGCNTFCMSVFANIPGSSVICGTVFNDNNFNSVIDLGDAPVDSSYVYLWGGTINQSLNTDASGNYSFNNLPAGTYHLQVCTWNFPNQPGINFTVPVDTGSCAYYNITIGANDTICGNNFGIYNNSSEISGTVFIDSNNNGIMDGNESGLSYQTIQIGNNFIYTDWYGNYSTWMLPGNYTVNFTPSPTYIAWNITTPTSYQINVTGPGNNYNGNNFGLYMPPGLSDLSIVITPHTTVTPGFPAWYDINVCNNGTSATGATVTMIYDAVLTTNYQTPNGTVNAPNHTISWTIANINPGTCSNIWTTFNALTGIQLGASTLEFVMVTPTVGTDINLSNNTDTVHQTIVGSWDPNNKLVVKTNNPADAATQFISSVNADQEITYTINFQNTGNAPAVNVVVIDEMPAELNVNSYQFISSSHTCEIIRIGNIVTYRFMNIMLPDSFNNEPNSHGFVNFKVNATNGLAMGTQIIDFANIYFDFNDPVLTNNAVVTMVDVTGVNQKTNASVALYPNPAKENFTVLFDSKEAGNAALVMFDNTGRKVLNTPMQISVGQNKTTISTANFENGIYFVEMIQSNGNVMKNVISIQK